MIKDFSNSLIKGRIAEIIFEQMFSEAGDYTIIPFGYERTTPEIAKQNRYTNSETVKRVIENIRTAPDYALISPNKNGIFLVEVKFSSKLNASKIVSIAKKQINRWDPSWIFVASLDGFYFGECSNIIKYGKIQRLKYSIIKESIQEKFLRLIQKFEK